MTSIENKNKKDEATGYEQIDITDGYVEAFKEVSADSKTSITPNLKEKIYPEGVKKITYSPQTESIYYFKSDGITSHYPKSWELFEDRGALIESKMIENLKKIKAISEDYEAISHDELLIKDMRNVELLEAIINFIKSNGSKAYRYRIDKGTKEKCKIFSFMRANLMEEIVFFGSDQQLFLNREVDADRVHQKAMKYMNRTVLSWFYEGLLRMKRLETKQKKYLAKIKRYQA
ncbi:MAG: hypothetical protein ACXABK_01055 [Candidatus Heimdallarchaeaceae archaeon]|jgi:hypothetical protein